MNKFKILMLGVLILVSLSSVSYSSSRNVSGITEDQWNRVISRIELLFGPYAVLAGLEIKVRRDWVSSEVNAYTVADLNNTSKRWIRVMGGLARSEWSTEDSLAAVVCHEFGHHFGGYSPDYGTPLWDIGWGSATEGAADYFASTKCLRQYFEDQDNIEYLKNISVPPFLNQKCQEHWGNTEEAAICIRSSLAGRQLLKVWTNHEYSFDTPDPKIINKSLHTYPSNQCRLDTFFHGALCTADKGTMPRFDDNSVGVCDGADVYRPLCWFLKK